MKRNRTLIGKVNKQNPKNNKIGSYANIKEFVNKAGFRGKNIGRVIPSGIYLALEEIGNHVDTFEDLKKLAESADGFSRLKNGVYFNNGRVLPYKALTRLGEKKLEALNEILSEHNIEPIPWITRKYSPWERNKERGRDWYRHLII